MPTSISCSTRISSASTRTSYRARARASRRPTRTASSYFISHTHYIEVRRRWYNPNKWLRVLAGRLGETLGGRAPRSLTAFATLLAGRKHSASRVEWLAHLAGETGHQLGRQDQIVAALGFVAAAVRFRLEDAADLAWVPVDAVLRSRFLSGIFVTGPVLAVVLAIVHHDGRYGMVLNIQDPFCVGACTWGAIFGLRKYRKVKPPEPKPRRAKG